MNAPIIPNTTMMIDITVDNTGLSINIFSIFYQYIKII